MARGYPDYSSAVGKTEEGVFLQLRALPPEWFHDDFESPVRKWYGTAAVMQILCSDAAVTGEGGAVSGSASMHIISPVGALGSVNVSYTGIPPLANIGIAVTFKIGLDDNFLDASNSFELLESSIFTGTRERYVQITYNPNDGNWYIYDGVADALVNFLTCKILWGFFHYVKVIFNFSTLKYVSFRIDDTIVDLSAYTIWDGASTAAKSMAVLVSTRGATGKQAEAWIDDYKITYGES